MILNILGLKKKKMHDKKTYHAEIKGNKMNVLVKFFVNCGRMGNLEGVFITTKEKLLESIGKEMMFYEVLGKHSEIGGQLEEKEVSILSEDQEFISKLKSVFGSDTISGVNPIKNIEQRLEELQG